MPSPAYGTYNAQSVRTPPTDPNDLAAWLRVELQNIARAVPQRTTKTVTANYTATPADDVVLGNATGGAFTVTLPLASQAQGMTVTVKKIDSSGNAVTLGATIDGTVSPTLATQWKAKTLRSDGSAWYTISAV